MYVAYKVLRFVESIQSSLALVKDLSIWYFLFLKYIYATGKN